jgi:hypothetical protein
MTEMGTDRYDCFLESAVVVVVVVVKNSDTPRNPAVIAHPTTDQVMSSLASLGLTTPA